MFAQLLSTPLTRQEHRPVPPNANPAVWILIRVVHLFRDGNFALTEIAGVACVFHVSWLRFVRLQDGKAAAQLNSISAPRNFRGRGKCAGEGGGQMPCSSRSGVRRVYGRADTDGAGRQQTMMM